MSDQNLELLSEFINKSNQCIAYLKKLKDKTKRAHTRINLGRSVSTLTSTFGTLVMTSSLLIAPFTGGLSITTAGIGGVMTMTGAALSILCELIDFICSKYFAKKIQNALEERNKTFEKLKECFDEIEQVASMLESNETDSDVSALYATYLVLKKGVKSKTFSKDLADINTVKNATKSLTNLTMKKGENFRLGLKMQSEMLTRAFAKLGINLGKRAAMTFIRTGTVIFSILFVYFDIKSLIQNWKTNHPVFEQINNLIEILRNDNANIQEKIEVLSCFDKHFNELSS